MTDRHSFSHFLYTLFSGREIQTYRGGMEHDFFNSNNHTMKQNKGNWRQSVTISKLPKLLLFGIMIALSTFTFTQSGNTDVPLARMMHNNSVTIRTGLNETYKIPVGHFGFSTVQEAEAYFQARDVAYIDFVVVDVNTVLLQFDLDNPAVADWTLAEWNQALETRAATVAPRELSNN